MVCSGILLETAFQLITLVVWKELWSDWTEWHFWPGNAVQMVTGTFKIGSVA